MKRLIERIDSRLEAIDQEMRLSPQSRERMVEDFRALSHEMETRLERVVRGFEHQIAGNNEALDRVLDAVNSRSRAIQHVLARPPPLPGEGV